MKAAVVVANEDVRYQVIPGYVKVKVKASGICGSDISRVLHNGVHFYPIVLGHEFSGDVVEVGEGVTKVKVGERVSGAPLLPCMKCDDCQNGNFSLCKHYSFIGSRQQGSNAEFYFEKTDPQKTEDHSWRDFVCGTVCSLPGIQISDLPHTQDRTDSGRTCGFRDEVLCI